MYGINIIINIVEESNAYTHTNTWRNHTDIMFENRWPEIAWNFTPEQKPRKCCNDDCEASASITFYSMNIERC
jgi:hypothetical protein